MFLYDPLSWPSDQIKFIHDKDTGGGGHKSEQKYTRRQFSVST